MNLHRLVHMDMDMDIPRAQRSGTTAREQAEIRTEEGENGLARTDLEGVELSEWTYGRQFRPLDQDIH